MCLKLTVSFSNGVLQAILSLAVLLNCIFGNSNVDRDFLSDVLDFIVFFLCHQIGNLIRTPRMCLKT